MLYTKLDPQPYTRFSSANLHMFPFRFTALLACNNLCKHTQKSQLMNDDGVTGAGESYRKHDPPRYQLTSLRIPLYLNGMGHKVEEGVLIYQLRNEIDP